MQTQHETHIIATYHAMAKYLGDIRQVIATGVSSDGDRYAPLPEPQRSELLQSIDDLLTRLEEVMRALVPEWETRETAVKTIGAARMWISTMLLLTQKQVEDILPQRMGRQYGELPGNDAMLLQAGVEHLQDAVASILSRLDAMKPMADGNDTA